MFVSSNLHAIRTRVGALANSSPLAMTSIHPITHVAENKPTPWMKVVSLEGPLNFDVLDSKTFNVARGEVDQRFNNNLSRSGA